MKTFFTFIFLIFTISFVSAQITGYPSAIRQGESLAIVVSGDFKITGTTGFSTPSSLPSGVTFTIPASQTISTTNVSGSTLEVALSVPVGTFINLPFTYKGATGNAVSTTITLQVTAALPIELLEFKAESMNKQVKLDWKTGEEENVNYFELQRSKNGKDFISVAKVKTGSYKKEYSFIDEKPNIGVSYYRLRMAENDGSAVKYSKSVSVNIAGNNTLIVSPTLATSNITVELHENNDYTTIDIMDLAGKIVVSKKTNSVRELLEIGHLPAGTYLISAQTGAERIVERFVKQ